MLLGIKSELTSRPEFRSPREAADPGWSRSYEPCWPSIMADAHGVVLVYNPQKAQQEQEVTLW